MGVLPYLGNSFVTFGFFAVCSYGVVIDEDSWGREGFLVGLLFGEFVVVGVVGMIGIDD